MTIEPTSVIKTLNLESEMRSSYLDYAMSVIVRARSLMFVTDSSLYSDVLFGECLKVVHVPALHIESLLES